MQTIATRARITRISLQMSVFAFKILAPLARQGGENSSPTVCKQMNKTTILEADLLYEVRDGVGRITFNRPQARNSLTFGMYERLAEICASTGEDRSLKGLILTG